MVARKRFKNAKVKKTVLNQSELAELLKDDVDIAAASKEACSGIDNDTLRKASRFCSNACLSLLHSPMRCYQC